MNKRKNFFWKCFWKYFWKCVETIEKYMPHTTVDAISLIAIVIVIVILLFFF